MAWVLEIIVLNSRMFGGYGTTKNYTVKEVALEFATLSAAMPAIPYQIP